MGGLWESVSEREPGSEGACKKGRVEETEQESGRRERVGTREIER